MNAISFMGMTPIENKRNINNDETLMPIVVSRPQVDTFESSTQPKEEKKTNGFLNAILNLTCPTDERRPSARMRRKANSILTSSIIKRDETLEALKMATGPNKRDFILYMENQGTIVRFGKDNNGNRTLVLRDSNGNLISRTGFDEKTKRVLYIESPASRNGKKIDRIEFQNASGTRFELKRNYKLSDSYIPTMSEYYKFSNGNPLEYKKDCVDFDGQIVGDEEYIF